MFDFNGELKGRSQHFRVVCPRFLLCYWLHIMRRTKGSNGKIKRGVLYQAIFWSTRFILPLLFRFHLGRDAIGAIIWITSRATFAHIRGVQTNPFHQGIYTQVGAITFIASFEIHQLFIMTKKVEESFVLYSTRLYIYIFPPLTVVWTLYWSTSSVIGSNKHWRFIIFQKL